MSSEDGLRILKETRDLDASFIAAGGLRDRLLRRLSNAHNNLEAAQQDITTYHTDEEVQQLLARCQESIQQLVDLDGQN